MSFVSICNKDLQSLTTALSWNKIASHSKLDTATEEEVIINNINVVTDADPNLNILFLRESKAASKAEFDAVGKCNVLVVKSQTTFNSSLNICSPKLPPNNKEAISF